MTLGGGFGWLVRSQGLTVDNLLGAEVVTADGSLVRASETENSDLFWGLKGGGGNFGVVTSFTFQAHPLGPQVLGGDPIYEVGNWGRALRAYRDWTIQLDERMTSIISFLLPPPEFELGDRVLMLLGIAWAGADQTRAPAVSPRFAAAAPADVEAIGSTAWVAWQSASDPVLPKGVRAYWKNAFFADLGDELIETLTMAPPGRPGSGRAPIFITWAARTVGAGRRGCHAVPEPQRELLAQPLRLLGERVRRRPPHRLGSRRSCCNRPDLDGRRLRQCVHSRHRADVPDPPAGQVPALVLTPQRCTAPPSSTDWSP